MKITLTIEIDNVTNSVSVVQEEPKDNKEPIKNSDLSNVVIPEHLEDIGEPLPKGRNSTMPRPRTDEYPFTIRDAKDEIERYHISMVDLAKTMGNFPIIKLRNIFRYDTRRLTQEDYNIILRAIQEIVDARNNII